MTSPTTSSASSMSNEVMCHPGRLGSCALMRADTSDSEASRSFPSVASSSVVSSCSGSDYPRSAQALLQHTYISPLAGALTPIGQPPPGVNGQRRHRDICRHWARGYCNRGTTCGFLHAESMPGQADACATAADRTHYGDVPVRIRSTVACKDYSVGKCLRGDKCKFTHVLYYPHAMNAHGKQSAHAYTHDHSYGTVYYHTPDTSSDLPDSFNTASTYTPVSTATAPCSSVAYAHPYTYDSSPQPAADAQSCAQHAQSNSLTHQPYNLPNTTSSYTPSPYAQPFTPSGGWLQSTRYSIPAHADNYITPVCTMPSHEAAPAPAAEAPKVMQHRPYG